MSVSPVSKRLAPEPPAPVDPMKAKEKAALAKVAKEFEGVLLKQILEASKPLGHSGGGYAAMAVDALASGIQAGGGIGLADTIERALSAQHAGPKGGPQK